jgi:YaiO family outer membrane protein
MRKKARFILFILFVIIIELISVSWAETIEPLPDESSGSKNPFHLEVGGNYSWLDNNYGQWKAFDLRLKYSGINSIIPFGAISIQSRDQGSQVVYDFGSYIHFNPRAYMIAEISGAPEKDPTVVLYPRLRIDVSGYLSIPEIDGLVLTTGITHIPKQNGYGGDIVSVGGIYYGKIILSGSLSLNIAHPGKVTSLSGQIGAMYGTEGKYWIGGGVATGRVAYQLASTIPFDVRYQSRGANLYYTRWLEKNWGFKTRLDHQNLKGAYKLYGITTCLFIDF